NCTVRNSRLDEEDLDLDGQLNFIDPESERVKRFIVDLSDPRNFTRIGGFLLDSSGTGAGVTVDTLRTPNDRRVRAVRLTMLSGDGLRDEEFSRTALARLRLVGSPWLKRTDRVLSGIAGDSTAV